MSGKAGQAPLWDDGTLAIVRGVGYPRMNRSHFTSMDIWQSATPNAPSSSGWIGRWLDSRPRDSLSALNVGNTLPPMFVGDKVAGSSLPLGGLKPVRGALGTALKRLAQPVAGQGAMQRDAAQAVADWYENASSTAAALQASTGVDDALGTSSLASQLDVVARLINAQVPTRVYSVSLGGFDTHADEKATQQALLTQLADAVSGFRRRIDASTHRDDVTVMVFSEFGRRVPANLSQGTDHGTAGTAFLLGNRVRGGFVGEQPNLQRLFNDDLEVTTDFRSMYASLVEDVLNTDAEVAVPGWKARLPLLR